MSNEQKPALDNGIAKDISEFQTDKLKRVGNVNEKIVLPSKQELANEKSLHLIAAFDKNKLKATETVEKSVLPDKESKFSNFI